VLLTTGQVDALLTNLTGVAGRERLASEGGATSGSKQYKSSKQNKCSRSVSKERSQEKKKKKKKQVPSDAVADNTVWHRTLKTSTHT
jgi:hypothetical protein